MSNESAETGCSILVAGFVVGLVIGFFIPIVIGVENMTSDEPIEPDIEIKCLEKNGKKECDTTYIYKRQ